VNLTGDLKIHAISFKPRRPWVKKDNARKVDDLLHLSLESALGSERRNPINIIKEEIQMTFIYLYRRGII
jgi:hypothetical protein